MKLKEKDGFCHDVIMLGSNSYLNIANNNLTDKTLLSRNIYTIIKRQNQ